MDRNSNEEKNMFMFNVPCAPLFSQDKLFIFPFMPSNEILFGVEIIK